MDSNQVTYNISRHVPLKSVWLLQLYASQAYRAGLVADSDVDELDAELPVLIATMLCQAVELRLGKELAVGFRRTTSELHRMRGKIDVLNSARHQLLEKGRIQCSYNELTVDSDVNRLLLAALLRAQTLTSKTGHREIAQHCTHLARQFRAAGVTANVGRPVAPRRLGFLDRRPVYIAELLLNFSVPSSGGQGSKFLRPDFDEAYLRSLFEAALEGLYCYHLDGEGWKIGGAKTLSWPASSSSSATLPLMKTDIMAYDDEGALTIVDAKFASMASAPRSGFVPTLRSAHLYQIHAYVQAAKLNSLAGGDVHGAMVYAYVGDAVDEHFGPYQEFWIDGSRYTFAALDLRCTPAEIREAALRVLRT